MFFLKKKRKLNYSRKPLNRKKVRFKRKPKVTLRTGNLMVSRRKVRLFSLLYNFSVFLIGAALVYAVFFSPWLRVEEIVFRGDPTTDKEEIEEKIYSLMDKKHLGIFYGNHFFFLKKRKIEQTILEKFKIFESVEIKKNFFGVLEIALKKKDAPILICGEVDCVSLDENGVALEKVSFGDLAKFGSNVEVIYDESKSEIEIGKGLNTKSHLEFIRNIKKIIEKNSKIEIKELYTPLPSASEIKGKTAEGWLILFNTEVPLTANAEALRIILENEIKTEDRICLEYVDLRINGKVYYKFFDDCETLKKEQARQKQEQEKEEENKQ